MRVLLRICAAAIIALGFAGSMPGQAGPAVSFDSTSGFVLVDQPFTVGWQLSVNTSISVTSLGAYDSPFAEGLLTDHEVGIWNSSGTLLATVTVHAGTSDPLTGRFRYVDLVTALVLDPGTYTIGAL